MDQRKALLIVAAVVVAVFAIIIGTVYFLSRSLEKSPNSPSSTFAVAISSPSTQTPQSTPTPNPNLQVYAGSGYSLQYPKSWGLLSCTNSANFELDPYSSANSRIGCSFAVKPITVLVNKKCSKGTALTLGNTKVYKSVNTSSNQVSYEWCTQGNVPLDITERVSSNGARATGPGDFSPQVEQIIKTISPTPAS